MSPYGIKFPSRIMRNAELAKNEMDVSIITSTTVTQTSSTKVTKRKPRTSSVKEKKSRRSSKSEEKVSPSPKVKKETPAPPPPVQKTKASSAAAGRKFSPDDIQKLSLINCAREFGQFHKEFYVDIGKDSSKDNHLKQLALQTTKCYHLRNMFKRLGNEQQNYDQIKHYYHARLDEYRELRKMDLIKKLNSYRQQVKMHIDKWLKRKIRPTMSQILDTTTADENTQEQEENME
ncbi:unnamed protein product [Didymodactylos carnosus]|uniref:Uncharacterized protein n=1 Tax=Didymodactylos carnosus TaxID=1234261 RepID=A0A814SD98_9BILA|nr:unnamed protein product [Didymodactylos carnosus]CAF1144529.1 unnamed protein product [Didymodactylos carnosus]CAF3567218.1 unnamed protein product [Didymodactylos carnosus]CAF3908091.1 unnamed protein product [Didymodactylos carnosus]